MTLIQSSTPAAPVSLVEGKRQLRITWDDEDSTISGLLAAASAWVTKHLGRSLTSTTWTLKLDDFPATIRLPMPPAVSITSIKYLDTDGVEQTLLASAYKLFGAGGYDPFVVPAWNTSWPSTGDGLPDAVTVVYVAGETLVPDPVKQAVLLLLSHLFEHREAATDLALQSIPFGVDALLKDYRQHGF